MSLMAISDWVQSQDGILQHHAKWNHLYLSSRDNATVWYELAILNTTILEHKNHLEGCEVNKGLQYPYLGSL